MVAYCFCSSLLLLALTMQHLFMVDVWVLHPAGLAVAVHPAIIVAVGAPAVFVQHQKSQRKKPPKKVASAWQVPKKETNAPEQQRQEAIIVGNMHVDRIFLKTIVCYKSFVPTGKRNRRTDSLEHKILAHP